MKRYFVTGTDTDCGKTYVTAELTQAYPNSVAIKPIASGCRTIDGQMLSEDVQQLVKYSNLSPQLINPWRFSLPVSPHIAAQQEDKYIDIQEVANFCMNFQLPDVETIFIEGAGGLMVPLNDEQTWVDFLKITQIPVLIVVGMKLGCINHALLTESVLRANKISCAGWIANCIDPNMLFLDENIRTIAHLLKKSPLALVPYSGKIKINH